MTISNSDAFLYKQAELIQGQFSQFKSWEDRYRFIMKSGKNLKVLPDEYKTSQYEIKGCESQVWLNYEITTGENGLTHCFFYAHSDARIVKGLLWLLLSPLDGLSCQAISAFDVDQYFENLGLLKHLSPSRGNGLKEIAQQVNEIAKKAQ